MQNVPKDYALSTAIKLVQANIESTNRWVKPEEATEFIDKTYSFLVDSNN